MMSIRDFMSLMIFPRPDIFDKAQIRTTKLNKAIASAISSNIFPPSLLIW